ncbi:uncharacterized protein LOC113272982 [Papaver somniferum]|uniref:uncharacterized protein LOC113272982 n=1 Tax=Papaver somniferum TaxID=3469 RepID=UPI000E701C54|nr:uncharacterized protein LOC113272982 [Papaver somniferum]
MDLWNLYIVLANGVSVDNDKIACIVNWPIPSSIKALHVFLGLTGYCRKFVKDYGKMRAPLTKLLKQNSFTWSDEEAVGFKQLQTALTTIHVLALPDFSKDFVLECDASSNGL